MCKYINKYNFMPHDYCPPPPPPPPPPPARVCVCVCARISHVMRQKPHKKKKNANHCTDTLRSFLTNIAREYSVLQISRASPRSQLNIPALLSNELPIYMRLIATPLASRDGPHIYSKQRTQKILFQFPSRRHLSALTIEKRNLRFLWASTTRVRLFSLRYFLRLP